MGKHKFNDSVIIAGDGRKHSSNYIQQLIKADSMMKEKLERITIEIAESYNNRIAFSGEIIHEVKLK